jgi:hypothetical protein
MRDTVTRASEASASGSHRSHGAPAGPSVVVAPHAARRDADVIRATVGQPAHRVRGWLVAAPR